MGTRVVFEIRASGGGLLASLYANGSHPMQDPEAAVDGALRACNTTSDLVEALLAERYRSDGGNHQKGDRMFWLVGAEEAMEGDREKVVCLSRDRGGWSKVETAFGAG